MTRAVTTPDARLRNAARAMREDRAGRLTWSDFHERANELGVPRREANWLKWKFAGAIEALPTLAGRRRSWQVRHDCGATITVHDRITHQIYFAGDREVVECPECGRTLGAGYMLHDVFENLPEEMQEKAREATMPVVGLTTGDRRPAAIRLGKFRKGSAKQKRQRADGSEYEVWGEDLPNYFRFVEDVPGAGEAVREAFGERPNHIDVIFPYADSVDGNWMAFQEEWVRSKMIHRCDGHWIWEYDDFGELRRTEKPCPYGPEADEPKERTTKRPGCQLVGRLTVIVPKLLEYGFYGHVVFETSSLYDIEALDAQMHDYFDRLGFGIGVHYVVGREWREVNTDRGNGKKVREEKSLMYISAKREYVQARLTAARREKLKELSAGTAVKALTDAQEPADEEVVDGAAAEAEIALQGAQHVEPDVTDELLDNLNLDEQPAPADAERAETSKNPNGTTNGDRPYDAYTLVERIEYLVGKYEERYGADEPSDDLRLAARLGLGGLVGKDDDKRHQLGVFLLDKESSNDWTVAECKALLHWIDAEKRQAGTNDAGEPVYEYPPNPYSLKEAQIALRAYLEEQGQQALF